MKVCYNAGMVSDDFKFVRLPAVWAKSELVTQLHEGTRWYVRRGSVIEFRSWVRELRDFYKGNLIPFSWVPEYVGVSRSAVHQRARAGGLTVFTFIVKQQSQTFLGGTRERDTRRRYDYATLSECEAWSWAVREWADEQEEKRRGDTEA